MSLERISRSRSETKSEKYYVRRHFVTERERNHQIWLLWWFLFPFGYGTFGTVYVGALLNLRKLTPIAGLIGSGLLVKQYG
ncbi:hypothetical protein PCO31111_05075 [Pandoraea communis]|uniref:Uncharacterized protein n=1 Tax=Pandoraea communis TaxID=2508297 RepID=A0A5E4Z407_9BURK|nr:hypothetical protein PCO31111_05075 [Pandoraea communis]